MIIRVFPNLFLKTLEKHPKQNLHQMFTDAASSLQVRETSPKKGLLGDLWLCKLLQTKLCNLASVEFKEFPGHSTRERARRGRTCWPGNCWTQTPARGKYEVNKILTNVSYSSSWSQISETGTCSDFWYENTNRSLHYTRKMYSVQSHFHLDYEENRKELDLTHLTPLLDKTFNNKNIFSVDRLPQWPTTGDLLELHCCQPMLRIQARLKLFSFGNPENQWDLEKGWWRQKVKAP